MTSYVMDVIVGPGDPGDHLYVTWIVMCVLAWLGVLVVLEILLAPTIVISGKRSGWKWLVIPMNLFGGLVTSIIWYHDVGPVYHLSYPFSNISLWLNGGEYDPGMNTFVACCLVCWSLALIIAIFAKKNLEEAYDLYQDEDMTIMDYHRGYDYDRIR